MISSILHQGVEVKVFSRRGRRGSACMSVGTTLIQSLYEAWVNIMLYECVSVLQERIILELLPTLKT